MELAQLRQTTHERHVSILSISNLIHSVTEKPVVDIFQKIRHRILELNGAPYGRS